MSSIQTKKTNVQHIVEEIGLKAVADQLSRAGSLTEADLCHMFGVGRSVIRESIKVLMAKGVITSRQKVGIASAPQSEWSLFDADVFRWIAIQYPSGILVKDFYRIRKLIAPETFSNAQGRMTIDMLSRLYRFQEQIDNDDKPFSERVDAVVDFHREILKNCNNGFCASIAKLLGTVYRDVIFKTRDDILMKETSYLLRQLVDALHRGNFAEAERLVKQAVDEEYKRVFPEAQPKYRKVVLA